MAKDVKEAAKVERANVLKPFTAEEPTQIRICPADETQFYGIIKYLLSLFDAVTIIQAGDNVTDGVLLDVYSPDFAVQVEGLARLRRSEFNAFCEFPRNIN